MTRGIVLQQMHLPVVVIESTFPLLPVGRYLLPLTSLNRYQLRCIHHGIFLPSIAINIYCQIWRVSLATIIFLDFVWIHSIQWILRITYRQNSHLENKSTRNQQQSHRRQNKNNRKPIYCPWGSNRQGLKYNSFQSSSILLVFCFLYWNLDPF